MPSKPTTEALMLAAADLIRTEVGDKFLKVFAVYTEELREECIASSLETLQQKQGIARQSSVLLQLLRDAPDEAKKIIEAENARRSRK
jgi:hypothetical protein